MIPLVLGQDTESQTAPDVLVGILHCSYCYQCMYVWITVSYFGQKHLLNALKCTWSLPLIIVKKIRWHNFPLPPLRESGREREKKSAPEKKLPFICCVYYLNVYDKFYRQTLKLYRYNWLDFPHPSAFWLPTGSELEPSHWSPGGVSSCHWKHAIHSIARCDNDVTLARAPSRQFARPFGGSNVPSSWGGRRCQWPALLCDPHPGSFKTKKQLITAVSSSFPGDASVSSVSVAVLLC